MNRRKLPRIQLDNKHLPYHWQENLVANQEIGGVFLVFMQGKDAKEIALKVKLLKAFTKTLKSAVKDFATVKPVKDEKI